MTLETQEPGSKKPFLCYLVFRETEDLDEFWGLSTHLNIHVLGSQNLQASNFSEISLKKVVLGDFARSRAFGDFPIIFRIFIQKTHFLSIPTTCKT